MWSNVLAAKSQIRTLQQGLTANNFELGHIERSEDPSKHVTRSVELMSARTEIYKSIMYLQFQIIETLESTIDLDVRGVA